MSNNIEAHVGDLWKLKAVNASEFFSVFLVEEVNKYYRDRVAGKSISIENFIIQLKDSTQLKDRDEKITDPKEIAYWLLRFEYGENA